MVVAFVMIKVIPGMRDWTKVLRDEITKLPGVLETHRIFGTYDIIVKTETNTTEELTNLVDEIRSMGAIETYTYVTH